MQGYGEDLAYIHDAGHSAYALGAAPGLLAILRRHGIRRGLVVDLGCGSGRWAAELNRAGYEVLGIDQSRAMIALARKAAPGAKFRHALTGRDFRLRSRHAREAYRTELVARPGLGRTGGIGPQRKSVDAADHCISQNREPVPPERGDAPVAAA